MWPLVSAVVLLSSCGVTREPPISPQQMVVLIGAVDIFDRVHTLGSGFVVRYSDRYYVATARHAIAEGAQKGVEVWFAIAKPSKKNDASDTGQLALGQPAFHANDSDRGTYDVAVLPVLDDASRMARSPLAEIALDAAALASEELAEGQSVTAIGYPASYIDAELNRHAGDRLPPLECAGAISHDRRALSSPQSGFTAPLVDFRFAATRRPCLGHGASGGLIVTYTDTVPRVVGMLVGSRELPPAGFVFTENWRILETLAAIAPP